MCVYRVISVGSVSGKDVFRYWYNKKFPDCDWLANYQEWHWQHPKCSYTFVVEKKDTNESIGSQ